MRIVQKYGGTSLGSADRIRAAAARLAALAQQGHQVVAVVSAQGDSTDRMIGAAAEINRRSSPREMDAYLAAGEQMSAALMAMALGAMGCGAVSLTGWQAGVHTESVHGNANILTIDCSRILRELAQGRIVIVAGFQGISDEGDITTLGRGGSDTTAVALAAYLDADKCQIYTDVDGIYDRDPRTFPNAVRFGRISYDRMLELAENGAQVLHDRSVALAKKHRIPVEVLSSFTGAPGTIVGELESL